MKSECEQIQEKILNPSPCTLSPQEKSHLRRCRACAEAAENAAAIGADLARFARRTDANLQARLSSGLKNRVASQLKRALSRQEAASGSQGPPIQMIPRAKSLWSMLFNRRRALVWAVCAAALIAVVGMAVSMQQKQRPIGKLVFAAGSVEVQQASTVQRYEGLGNWDCRRACKIQLPEQAMGVFSLGDRVRGALSGATTLEMVGPDLIELSRGEAWICARPGGKELTVRSPHGIVRVAGTSFGVAVTASETRVDVSAGNLVVTHAGQRVNVGAEQRLRVSAGGIDGPTPRPEKDSLPVWVKAVLAKEKAAHVGQYIPSLKD